MKYAQIYWNSCVLERHSSEGEQHERRDKAEMGKDSFVCDVVLLFKKLNTG